MSPYLPLVAFFMAFVGALVGSLIMQAVLR